MAVTTSITDGLVFPEDDGTGVADGSEDYNSAGYLSLLARNTNGPYVDVGLTFSGTDSDSNGNWDEVTVGRGHAYVAQSGVSVQSGSQTSYDTTLPNPAVVVVILPSSVTLSVSEGVSQYDIYLAFDPSTQDTAYFHHGASGSTSAPSDPNLYLGYVNTSANTTHGRNRSDPTKNSLIIAQGGSLTISNDEHEQYLVPGDRSLDVDGKIDVIGSLVYMSI